ncbi:MAG: gamma-glutamyl-gamma-aminobutyrate hydrolase family protein [Fusobacteriaceae bacterium]
MKPLIGITMFNEYNQKGYRYNSLSAAYVESVEKSGGIPVLIPVSAENLSKEYIESLDGIIFSGGEDVSPLYFGENPVKELGVVDTMRDECEKKLYEEAIKKNMPILGICRGCQAVNVYAGGNLYQDIPSQVKNAHSHSPSGIRRDEKFHNIKINKNSMLYEIFGAESIGINSYHHQSVKKLADCFKVTATSDDGIIEAYEMKNMEENFIMGIQWHPEGMINIYPEFLGIFKKFINNINNKKLKKK